MNVTEEQLRQEILSRAADGKVSCRAMLELAQRTDASAKMIGELCNELKLRISECQLGCFK